MNPFVIRMPWIDAPRRPKAALRAYWSQVIVLEEKAEFLEPIVIVCQTTEMAEAA